MKIQLMLVIIFLSSSSLVQGYESNAGFYYIDGSDGNLNDYSGTPLLIDAMATWCFPCIAAMNDLFNIKVSLGDRVDIVTISFSPASDDASKMLKFKTKAETTNDIIVSWDLAIDTDAEVFTLFPIQVIPTLILLGADGTFMKMWNGTFDPSEVVAEINSTIIYSGNERNLVNLLLSNPAFLITSGFIIIVITYVKLKPSQV